MRVRSGLGVNGDDIGPCFSKSIEEPVDWRDHEMNVERQRRMWTQRFDYHRADRDVGDEMAIHNIDMNPISPRRFDGAHFLTEAREICAQDRRGDADGIGHGAVP